MRDKVYKYLKFIRFKDVVQWDLKRYLNNSVKSKYEVVALNKLINEESKKYDISDKKTHYGILGVNNQTGVFDAYIESGAKIKQKYKKMDTGWIAYNPYRVNVGSIGIKRSEHKYDYISPAYVVFSCKPSILPEYLYMTMKTPSFNKIIRDNTTGSVRQNLSFDVLKGLNVPLPSIEVQKAIVNAYNDRLSKAKRLEQNVKEVENSIEDYLLSELGIQPQGYPITESELPMASEPQVEYVINRKQKTDLTDTCIWDDEIKKEYKYLKFVRFKDIKRWDVLYYTQNGILQGKYENVTMRECIDFFMKSPDGKSLRIETKKYPEESFQYIGMEDIEKNTGVLLEENIVKGDSIKSQTVKVPKNYFLYGKLRPYLNKYWYNDTDKNNIVCSSEFFVFSIKPTINPLYIKYYLSSAIVQQQISNAFRGARMPRINEDTFFDIEVQLPPIDLQNTIVEHIKKQKTQIKDLKHKTETLRKEALEEFEKEIFEQL